MSTAIITARLGLSRANAKHRQAINQMVAIIREHEQKHRTIIENEAIRALGSAQRFVGTGNTKEAEKSLTRDLECAMNKRHEALDKVEGLLKVDEQRDGSVRITKSGSGVKYPC